MINYRYKALSLLRSNLIGNIKYFYGILVLVVLLQGCETKSCENEAQIATLLKEAEKVCINYSVSSESNSDSKNEVLKIIDRLSIALEDCGDIKDLHLARGVCYKKTDPLKAIADYESSLKNNTNQPFVRFFIAEIYFSEGIYDKALSAITGEIKLGLHGYREYELRAKIVEKNGNLEAAIEDNNKALSLLQSRVGNRNANHDGYSPMQEDIYIANYNLLRKLGRNEAADKLLHEGLINNPGSIRLKQIQNNS